MTPRSNPGGRSRGFLRVPCVTGISAILLTSLAIAILCANPSLVGASRHPTTQSLAELSGNARVDLYGPAVTYSTGLSGESAGSLVRTVFPNFNASVQGDFLSTVWDWNVGSPAYVPSTHSLWLPVRATLAGGYPGPGINPAVIYNTTTNQFERFAFSIENASAFAYDQNNGFLYRADYANSTVGVLDPSSEAWLRPALPVGLDPIALALDTSTN